MHDQDDSLTPWDLYEIEREIEHEDEYSLTRFSHHSHEVRLPYFSSVLIVAGGVFLGLFLWRCFTKVFLP